MDGTTTLVAAYLAGLMPIYGMLFKIYRDMGSLESTVEANVTALEGEGIRRDGGGSPEGGRCCAVTEDEE